MRILGRPLGFVQVEVSTFCQLRCVMCPKTIFRVEWISKNLDMETFKRIPFDLFRFAHLQGWGEPLLNPEIVEMIDVARENCKVGLTTNGLLLDQFANDLVKRLDYIAISIASADDKTHREIRRVGLYDLIEKIKLVSELRRGKKPRITLVTMMLKSTVHDLPKLVDIAKNCGADEVIAF